MEILLHLLQTQSAKFSPKVQSLSIWISIGKALLMRWYQRKWVFVTQKSWNNVLQQVELTSNFNLPFAHISEQAPQHSTSLIQTGRGRYVIIFITLKLRSMCYGLYFYKMNSHMVITFLQGEIIYNHCTCTSSLYSCWRIITDIIGDEFGLRCSALRSRSYLPKSLFFQSVILPFSYCNLPVIRKTYLRAKNLK